MSSIKETLRLVFSNRNILITSLTSMIAFGVFNALWRTWWTLYLLEELGATIEIVGILAMIQTSSSLLFQLPGGILADRIGRKRVIVLGTSIRIIAPIIFFLAPSWEWAIPGLIANAAASVYSPGRLAMIAESLPYKKRATGFGIYRMFNAIPSIFMPLVSGIYMDHLGLGSGVRTGLIISSFGMTAAFIIRLFFLEETLVIEKPKTRSTPVTEEQRKTPISFRNVFANLRKIYRQPLPAMQVVSVISGFGLRMIASYMVVYGTDVMGLTKTEWGLLQTVASLCETPLYLVGGMIADKYGRIPCITFARFLLPIRQLGLIFLRDYNQLLVLYALIGIGGGLGGGTIRGGGFMGGPAWQSLVADVVPSKNRGKVIGLMATITGVSCLPAAPLGGFVWVNIGPNPLMVLSIIIGLAPLLIIRPFIKEPKTREK